MLARICPVSVSFPGTEMSADQRFDHAWSLRAVTPGAPKLAAAVAWLSAYACGVALETVRSVSLLAAIPTYFVAVYVVPACTLSVVLCAAVPLLVVVAAWPFTLSTEASA